MLTVSFGNIVGIVVFAKASLTFYNWEIIQYLVLNEQTAQYSLNQYRANTEDCAEVLP